MKRFFITYGDSSFEYAKKRIQKEAEDIKEFDEIIIYDYIDLSEALRTSKIINVKRGGGLWSWKPDIILSTIRRAQVGDVIVYCDSGCTLRKAKEWNWYWEKSNKYDLITQRIPMRNDKWSRLEVLQMFEGNSKGWQYCYQYEATVIILKVSQFTRKFVEEWWSIMVNKPELVMDVPVDLIHTQHKSFIENRHDQTIFSALVYKYISIPEYKDRILAIWERIEDISLCHKQAIRASRKRGSNELTLQGKIQKVAKRYMKHFILIPFYYAPRQRWFSKNKVLLK